MKYRTASRTPSNGAAARPHRGLDRLLVFYLALFLIAFALSIFVGRVAWTPGVVWDLWREGDPSFRDWFDLRVVRALLAATVGACLALAGLVFQAVLRNPLAEPYILGVSGGASLGVVGMTTLAPTLAGGVGGAVGARTLCALAGALAATALLLFLARLGRLFDPASLILLGVVLNSVFLAAILYCYSVASEAQVKAGLTWTMGAISEEAFLGGGPLRLLVVALILGTGFFASVARSLDLLALSEEEAADLGLAPRRFRIAALTVASAVTGVAVAAVGPVGFVGLVVPHALRRMHGPGHRRLVPLCAIAGALFLLVADGVARTAHPAQPIPVGVVTSLTGGPFFLALLVGRRRRQAREGDA